MRAPFLPAIHTPRRSLSRFPPFLFSRRTFAILLILRCISRFYRCILSSSSFSPPMRTHCVLVSSFSNFPRWRHRSLCSFLDTVERLNATTSPLCGFPLPLFFVFLPRGLIRPNGAIRRRGGKKDRSSAFVESFVESPDTCIY